ncbi:hypothetical protein COT44_04420 [Candidatus Shapirobacteria bacterium CG08_land_8_20_14_0_20_39_18]|uniref:LexA repressor n=1 Tax=Candidatus Shapirobacteria bacterium CG08_land_8_20_14_0_20_39_18 TaxID=1974883 RepID=A0A2M6XBQ8_9BACT|nr:MAG: hypothetical protein COT44_04420 [Candidatus Shapirobacteria bacterium CG08_land_8_20_14_0_20_39_18]PIY65303.1 MAG: hypothetical protein COY91_02710 [Candidatus Shapirobacteria bacterium CG_4_10_14_0_8_um_filter_39_15]PJE68379.1 MAG: hypothetical protein COU94_02240 [Candidatus Shapirobacteria bacterium CG10_big_fil_rev_8_21_14_0_10_38_8]
MKIKTLTPKQKKVLDFINKFIKKNGYSPSLEEMASYLKLNSVSTVHQFIEILKNKGYINKEENKPRSITSGFTEIPLCGYIAAGEPIEAISNPQPFKIPQAIVSKTGFYYALKVRGNSMVEDCIYDGDTIIIKHQDTAENGQKVVALIDNLEVTLKKIYKENGKIRLQPANRNMNPLFVDPSRVIIQGIVIDILKNKSIVSETPLIDHTARHINTNPKDLGELLNQVIEGDCLEVMNSIPNKSIDMILCDLPYGNTQNNWDSVIPLDKLWSHYERVIKNNGVIALTSQGLFTAKLILSNPKLFKYKIVWIKSKSTNFLNAKKQPLRRHEDICIFYKNQPSYNPQMSPGEPYNKGFRKNQLTGSYGDFNSVEVKSDGLRYPTDVVYYKTAESEGKVFHPTQKPVELGRYLIKTFTKTGDIVLDNTCGSGSFLVAAILEKRRFIGIEKNQETFLHKKQRVNYIEICKERIEKARKELKK